MRGFWNCKRIRNLGSRSVLSPGVKPELHLPGVCVGPLGLHFLSHRWVDNGCPAHQTTPGVKNHSSIQAPALASTSPPQDLEEAYQDAASNVLVAICRHSWRAVAQHLETEVLTGVFPHRSLLYVMGILTSNSMSHPWGLRAPYCWVGDRTTTPTQFSGSQAWLTVLRVHFLHGARMDRGRTMSP